MTCILGEEPLRLYKHHGRRFGSLYRSPSVAVPESYQDLFATTASTVYWRECTSQSSHRESTFVT